VLWHGAAENRYERRDVDNRAAARLEQLRDAVLAAQKHTLEVDIEYARERLLAGLLDRGIFTRHDARVIVEHVEAPECAHTFNDPPLYVCTDRHIARNANDLTPSVAHQRHGLFEWAFRIVVGDDFRTRARERLGGHTAHAAARSGD